MIHSRLPTNRPAVLSHGLTDLLGQYLLSQLPAQEALDPCDQTPLAQFVQTFSPLDQEQFRLVCAAGRKCQGHQP